MLSVLAGDIFRGTRVRLRLVAFKFLYYLFSIGNFRANLAMWRKRREAARERSADTVAT
jgi:hypothetical protein